MKVFHKRLPALLLAAVLITSSLILPTGKALAISLIRDAEIEGLLRDYTDPIIEAAGLQPDAVDIYIVNDKSLNAFVAGGKNIFVHTGLIVEAEKPMELIGVLAHETGHIAGSHLARRSDGQRAATMPMLIGLGLGIIAAIAGAPDVGMAAIAGGQHVAMMEFLAYTRVQESAADQAAVTYLERTGQSSRGLYAFFEKFRYTEVFDTRSRHIPPYWRTHPMSGDRINALANRIEASEYRDVEDSAESVRRFTMVQAKLRGFINPTWRTLNDYPLEDTSAEARYARAISWYRDVQIDKAVAEIDSLISEDPTNPYFRELKGQLLFETGRVAESIPHHRKAVELAPDEPLIRISLAQALIAEPGSEDDPKRNLEARAELQRALKNDEANPFAYNQLAITWAREGNEGMAALSTAEQYYYAGGLAGAAQFAVRAQQQLEKGTPAWHRASDIVNVARNAIEDQNR